MPFEFRIQGQVAVLIGEHLYKIPAGMAHHSSQLTVPIRSSQVFYLLLDLANPVGADPPNKLPNDRVTHTTCEDGKFQVGGLR